MGQEKEKLMKPFMDPLKGLVEAWHINRENSDSVMESGFWKDKYGNVLDIIEKYFGKS